MLRGSAYVYIYIHMNYASAWQIAWIWTESLFLRREYTVQFARCMVDMFDALTDTPRGRPELPEPVPPAQVSYERMFDEDFGCGFHHVHSVFEYLRKGKHLVIPEAWRAHIPKAGEY